MYMGRLLSWREVMLKRSVGRETWQRWNGEPPGRGMEEFAVVNSDGGFEEWYFSSVRGTWRAADRDAAAPSTRDRIFIAKTYGCVILLCSSCSLKIQYPIKVWVCTCSTVFWLEWSWVAQHANPAFHQQYVKHQSRQIRKYGKGAFFLSGWEPPSSIAGILIDDKKSINTRPAQASRMIWYFDRFVRRRVAITGIPAKKLATKHQLLVLLPSR